MKYENIFLERLYTELPFFILSRQKCMYQYNREHLRIDRRYITFFFFSFHSQLIFGKRNSVTSIKITRHELVKSNE